MQLAVVPSVKHGLAEVVKRVREAPDATAEQDWAWLGEELEDRPCAACAQPLQRWETLNRSVQCQVCDRRRHPEASNADQGDQDRKRKLDAWGVPPAYQHCTAARWKGKVAAEFATFANEPRGFWFIYGKPGRGKTHLAIAALERVALAGSDTFYAAFRDTKETLSRAKAAMLADDHGVRLEGVLRSLRDCQLLVLDDLGSERGTDYEASVIADVLRYRHMQEKPTIVTSNLTPDELRALTPSLASRILSHLETNLGGADRRLLHFRPKGDEQ